jgi:hypothetical protein
MRRITICWPTTTRGFALASSVGPMQQRHSHIIDRDVPAEGTVIGYDPAEDKRHYHVTPSGLTVVTRNHSLYESPVDSDYLNGPR